jgi:hypothetical protein
MKLAVICEKCGKIHNEDTDGANIVIDFKDKKIFCICQNKDCKHENSFDFGDWQQKSKASPLPNIQIM